MQIKDLFEKDVARPIEGVIKADDDRNLLIELEEYVATRDVVRGLGALTERYLDDTSANGVWISGFFGSGKSHLLKILSLVLDSRPLANGKRAADIVLPKIDDEILKGELRRAAAVPAQSILFNIDQKFDGIGGDHSAPILEVFVKVLNELQGYFGNQGYIAQFEHHLAQRGEFAGFKATYRTVNGRDWEVDREAVATASRAAFGRAYAQHFGVTEADAAQVMRQARDDYKVSIESFAKRVKEYLDAQEPGFRLNFFVDEIGQFIGQERGRMLNLQTLAETLSTVCKGRAWVFVTSQADLEQILGEFTNLERQDITKIKGRFKTQITLASADVQEVIQRRLLAKREAEPAVLTEVYDREKDNLATLFRFGDGSLQLKSWRGSDEFCALYPFNPYQMALFQTAIMALSQHDQFTGRYLSVGERSMLAVFQDVAKGVKDLQVGTLATFDMLYDGLAPSLRGDVQTSIRLAERQLDKLPVRILKALFLLKWAPGFKATKRNVAILLIDRPDVAIAGHEKAVAAGLAELEGQSYLQRNGDVYEFLTDKEKDIEKEIKATDVDESEVAGELVKVLFTDTLRDPKIRYEATGQDFNYARRIDDALAGREFEIGVNLITTENRNRGNLAALVASYSGKAELVVVLPENDALVSETRQYLKTQKFVQRHAGDGDPTRKAILDRRAEQNAGRRTDTAILAAGLLAAADVYLNGSRLDALGQADARSRMAKAGQSLIDFAYPSLKMLPGTYDEAGLTKVLTTRDDLLASGALALSEAENEVFIFVSRKRDSGERTTAADIVNQFGKRPYGWLPMGALTTLARLFRMGKVELRTTELVTAQEAVEQLRNSRNWAGVRVAVQEQFDATKINALKRFHQEFFDKGNTGTDARSVAAQTTECLKIEAEELEKLAKQEDAYGFLSAVKVPLERVQRLAQKDYNYLLNNLAAYSQELLDAKDNLLAPIKAFMNGAQKVSYDEAIGLLKAEAANLTEVADSELQPIRDMQTAAAPYRGSLVPAAKAAVAKVRGLLAALLKGEREAATAKVEEKRKLIEATPDFAKLDADQQAQVLAQTQTTLAAIAANNVLTGIRDLVRVYSERHFNAQLDLASKLAMPPPEPQPPTPAPTHDDSTGALPVPTPRPPVPAPAPRVIHVPLRQLRLTGAPVIVTSVAELDQYLAALRTAIAGELKKGNRVTV